jgi:hypothetical protein
MATVNLFGRKFHADPISENPDGSWLMTALEHTARCSPGDTIRVEKREIVSMEPSEMPDPAASQAALEADLAKERATLPPPETYMAGVVTHPDAGREKGVSVSVRPIQSTTDH